MALDTVRTTNLEHGWHADERADGSMTIRNGGERIDLPPASVELLQTILKQAAAA